MDQQHDIPQSGSSVSVSDAVRDLGLTLVRPINAYAEDPAYLYSIWQRVKTQEYMFNDFERGNEEGFLARLFDLRHLHLMIGEDGYCILLNAWCQDSPEIHFCVWNESRPLNETLKAASEVLNFTFGQLQAVRITAMMPDFHPQSIKLATLLGFKYEGEMRNGVKYMGKYYNVQIYGILKDEWVRRAGRV